MRKVVEIRKFRIGQLLIKGKWEPPAPTEHFGLSFMVNHITKEIRTVGLTREDAMQLAVDILRAVVPDEVKQLEETRRATIEANDAHPAVNLWLIRCLARAVAEPWALIPDEQ